MSADLFDYTGLILCPNPMICARQLNESRLLDRSSEMTAGTHGDTLDTKGGRTLTKFRPLIPQKQACVPNEQTAAFGLFGKWGLFSTNTCSRL